MFAELELAEAAKKVAGVRVRQHVNPLKASLQTQAPAPAWREVFADVARPLIVDIGCGGGRFDLMMAKRFPEKNVLGVDIRAPLVDRGNAWGAHAGLIDNLHFAECNATVSIGRWLRAYSDAAGIPRAVEMVTIQFPDPHFKKRHRKRRVVQPALVRAVAEGLRAGARVFLQSDVLGVAEDMRDKFERFGAHLFELDARLHDVSEMDAGAVSERARGSVEAARRAHEEDERARRARERAEARGVPGENVFAKDARGDVRPRRAAASTERDGGDEKASEEEEGRVGVRVGARGRPRGVAGREPARGPDGAGVPDGGLGGRCYRVMLVATKRPCERGTRVLRLLTKKPYCLLIWKKCAPSRSAGTFGIWVSKTSSIRPRCKRAVVVTVVRPARAHSWEARRGRRRDARRLSGGTPRRLCARARVFRPRHRARIDRRVVPRLFPRSEATEVSPRDDRDGRRPAPGGPPASAFASDLRRCRRVRRGGAPRDGRADDSPARRPRARGRMPDVRLPGPRR